MYKMKRGFDVFASLSGLVLLSPLLLLIGLMIKLDDGGTILFKHNRVGKDGKFFTLYKFRTMFVHKPAGNSNFEPGNISRITRTGKILRKTKLDELPQLFNVLKGEMSIVGPRPEVAKWVEVYPERWQTVLTVRPGMTDHAAIAFRNEEVLLAASEDPEKTYQFEILPKKLDLYDEYIMNPTFFGDLRIIFKTIRSVVKH